MITHVQGIAVLFFLLVGLSWLTSNHLIFGILTLAILYLGIKQFIIDRKYYKGMLNSARKDVPVWRILVGIVLLVVVMNIQIPIFNMDHVHFVYPLISIIGLFLGLYYQQYQDSLKSFEKGLLLPGKAGKLIPWKEINEITVQGETVTIMCTNDQETIEIDRRDMKEMVAIVETWKSTLSTSQ